MAFKIEVRQNLSEEVTLMLRTEEWTEASHGQSWGRWCSKCKGPGAGINMGCLKNMVSKEDQRGEKLDHSRATWAAVRSLGVILKHDEE